MAADPVRGSLDAFCMPIPGARPLADNRQVAEAADILLLAVKPQQVAAVAEQLGGRLDSSKLLVSIAAGVRLRKLAELLQTERLVRVMPNTPCLVGCVPAATAWAPARRRPTPNWCGNSWSRSARRSC